MSSHRNMRAVDINPCLEESEASSKCLDVNNYQRDMCALYFIRYKQCRKFWMWDPHLYGEPETPARRGEVVTTSRRRVNAEHTVMLKRRGDGVTPAMPTHEERKQILASLENLPY
ncbi:coiled-coil-helix-coiled-coil-helix domain-containing protein 7 isoform X1 [Rhinoderma darwinii]|uniref:coiled-coil-helix-coiled-coil-helix domain-containing protein 7 isoform X1 n=1 Tax=Rhinoderma darwinii TaxID=43563 RepID=UPI003F679966